MNLPHRQPDDPGIGDLDSSEYFPVIFKPSMIGRETAWLNDVMIGEIMIAGWGQLRRAQARLELPGIQKIYGADNVIAAKRKLVDVVREWIPAAGLRT